MSKLEDFKNSLKLIKEDIKYNRKLQVQEVEILRASDEEIYKEVYLIKDLQNRTDVVVYIDIKCHTN